MENTPYSECVCLHACPSPSVPLQQGRTRAALLEHLMEDLHRQTQAMQGSGGGCDDDKLENGGHGLLETFKVPSHAMCVACYLRCQCRGAGRHMTHPSSPQRAMRVRSHSMETMAGHHRHRGQGGGGGVPPSLSGGILPQNSSDSSKSTFSVRGGWGICVLKYAIKERNKE